MPWSRAWGSAAYGSGGFYIDGPGSTQGPAAHFATSAHRGITMARALVVLLDEIDARLQHPQHLDVVDVGAGRGELLTALLSVAPADLLARIVATAIDVRPRPDALDDRIRWIEGAAPHTVPHGIQGLIVANEWLDDVPLDVVQVDDRGELRLVLVDVGGQETLGPRLTDTKSCASLGVDAAACLDWLERWWPIRQEGECAEVGLPRDVHWADCIGRLNAGTAIAIDYGHTHEQRIAQRFAAGTLTAYRSGRIVASIPDGSVNITAHVAVDSVAHAVGATIMSQRTALHSLGIRAVLPEHALAASDPGAYADALEAASNASELLDPASLGAFHWIRADR